MSYRVRRGDDGNLSIVQSADGQDTPCEAVAAWQGSLIFRVIESGVTLRLLKEDLASTPALWEQADDMEGKR